MNFGITFDGRNPSYPKSESEAVARVRAYAERDGVQIPDTVEPTVRKVDDWGYSGLQVLFEWSEESA